MTRSSILQTAFKGIAWSAGSGGLQLVVSMATFSFVASQLSPTEIGAFGIAALIAGFVEILTARPFGESLQQRPVLRRAHLNSTFWFILLSSSVLSLGIVLFAVPISVLFKTELAAPLIITLVVWIPISAFSTVNDAILIRRLKFDLMAKVGGTAAILSGLVAIAAISLGAGVWSLILSDVFGRLYRFIRLWQFARYKPGPISDLAAGRDLLKFNINTFLTYLLGFADQAAPRALTGALLGPAALGYLIIGQKFMGLIMQLVLSPIASVTMATIARVQSDLNAVRDVIVSFYKLAAIISFPAFLGAILVIPDLALLFGDKWLPSVIVAQILLLRGIRYTTGVLNVSILRGVGHSGTPLILLGSGLTLNLLLIPIGASWGIVGVALAMLARTLLTWPVGLYLVKRATGLSVTHQFWVGTSYLVYAALMMAGVYFALSIWPSGQPMVRALSASLLGICIYAGLIFVTHYRNLSPAINLIVSANRKAAFKHVQQAFSS